MTSPGPAEPQPSVSPEVREQPKTFRQVWLNVRNRILEGLVVVLPILVTCWIVWWLYSNLEKHVIDPLAMLVLWKGRWVQGTQELPYWFETYAAPVIAIFLALGTLYCCGVLAHSRLRRLIDNAFLRVPVISQVYEAVQAVLKCLDKPSGQAKPQRVVLVSFPHPGMRLPAIVTSTCRDIATGKTLLCVYVPTAPVPGSGFVLIVPEEDATELNWDMQQTLQAIFSGGLTSPDEVTYYSKKVAANAPPDALA